MISSTHIGFMRMFLDEPVFGAPDDWGEEVHCPICGDNNVHFGRGEDTDSDDYTAWQGRGSALRIRMWCESGHEWTLRFGFHKGTTYLAIEDVLQVK